MEEGSLTTEVLERLHTAQNHHDLDAFVSCFDPDYRSEQPAHPDRGFVGSEQVRRNWAEVFTAVPDFQAKLLRSAQAADTGWAEWHWHGTRWMGRGWTCAESPSSESATIASSGVDSTSRTWRSPARESTRPSGAWPREPNEPATDRGTVPLPVRLRRRGLPRARLRRRGPAGSGPVRPH